MAMRPRNSSVFFASSDCSNYGQDDETQQDYDCSLSTITAESTTNGNRHQRQSRRQQKFHSCCMPQCANAVYSIAHRFPLNQQRNKIWLQAINSRSLFDLMETAKNKVLFLCARHFRPQDYVPGSCTLNRSALPNLNLRDLSQLHLCRQVDIKEPYGSVLTDELCREKLNEQKLLLGREIDDSEELTEFDVDTEDECLSEMLEDTFEEPKAKRRKLPSDELEMSSDMLELLNENLPLPSSRARVNNETSIDANLSKQKSDDDVKESSKPATPVKDMKQAMEFINNDADEPSHADDTQSSGQEILAHVIANTNDKNEANFDTVAQSPLNSPSTLQNSTTTTDDEDNNAADIAEVQQFHSKNASSNAAIINDYLIVLSEHTLVLKKTQQWDLLKLDLQWLRYQCYCHKCYDQSSKSSRLDLAELSAELPPLTVDLRCNKIHIKWHSGHYSSYDILQLQQAQRNIPNLPTYTLWSTVTSEGMLQLQPFAYNKLLQSEYDIMLALTNLRRYGVVIINELPERDAPQRKLLQQLLLQYLFPQLPVNNWQQETRKNFCQSHTMPFTNCTFESMDCGLQILSLSADSNDDVRIILADGFAAANELYVNERTTFLELAQCKQTIAYKDASGFQYDKECTVLQLQKKRMERINFAPYQLGMQLDFYKFAEAMQVFAAILQKPEKCVSIKMSKDQLLILDNYRICWLAQHAVKHEANGNNVELDCTYLERKYYLSRLKNLKVSRMQKCVEIETTGLKSANTPITEIASDSTQPQPKLKSDVTKTNVVVCEVAIKREILDIIDVWKDDKVECFEIAEINNVPESFVCSYIQT